MIKFNGYEFTSIRAVAHSAGDNEIQDAILVHSVGETGESFDYIYFGWDMPETNEDAMQLLHEAEHPSALFCIDENGVYHEGIYDLDELNEEQ